MDSQVLQGLVEISKGLNKTNIELEGHVYEVLNENTIYNRFVEYQMELYDDLGLESFSQWALDYILDNFLEVTFFEEIAYDDAAYEFDEMSDSSKESYRVLYKADTVEDAREIYIETMTSGVDHVDYYRGVLGDTEFKSLIKTYNLLDMPKVIDWILEMDGFTCLAWYDGNIEVYYDETEEMMYYIYITE